MREIDNNNINNVNFKGIQKPAVEDVTNEETAAIPTEMVEIKDLSKMPGAALGKSQISTDSLENDMKFLEKNPKLVQELNMAIENYATNHSEEETLKMIEKVHQEFVAKK